MMCLSRVGLAAFLAMVCLVNAELIVSPDYILIPSGSAIEITITYIKGHQNPLSVYGYLPDTLKTDNIPATIDEDDKSLDSLGPSNYFNYKIAGEVTEAENVPIVISTLFSETKVPIIKQEDSFIGSNGKLSEEEEENSKLTDAIKTLGIDAQNMLVKSEPKNTTRNSFYPETKSIEANGVEIYNTSLEHEDPSPEKVRDGSPPVQRIPLDENLTLRDESFVEDSTFNKTHNVSLKVPSNSEGLNVTPASKDLVLEDDSTFQQVNTVYSDGQNLPIDPNTTFTEDSLLENKVINDTSFKQANNVYSDDQTLPINPSTTFAEDSLLENKVISNMSLEENHIMSSETNTTMADISLSQINTNFVDNSSLETILTTLKKDSNESSEDTIPETNSILAQTLGNRRKRNLPIVSDSDSAENVDSSLESKLIVITTKQERNKLTPSQSLLEVNESLTIQSWQVTLYGDKPGNIILLIQLQPADPSNSVVVHVDVERDHFWSVASSIIGWIYFVAWGLSAHCQLFLNWNRKSVIGLNFDYLGWNMIGHSLYGVYNILLYFSHPIQEEYFQRNPLSANPIQLNDVMFSIHNSLVTLFTVYQCFRYERGNQRLSNTAILLYTMYAVWLFFSGLLACLDKIEWLDFINQCALIKLTITLIKYAPQAYMNYRRKSTVGWSIGNVLLDLIGGLFSFLQMIILAYNFDDWHSFLTDTTKLGLALFTIMFDVLFMLQHYVLYPDHEDKSKNIMMEEEISKKGVGNGKLKSHII